MGGFFLIILNIASGALSFYLVNKFPPGGLFKMALFNSLYLFGMVIINVIIAKIGRIIKKEDIEWRDYINWLTVGNIIAVVVYCVIDIGLDNKFDFIFSTIILVIFMEMIPAWIIMMVASDPESSGDSDTCKYNINTNNSPKEKSFDYNVKTSDVKDNFGNVVGKVRTTSYEDKYGGFETKEILDEFGIKKGEIHTWK